MNISKFNTKHNGFSLTCKIFGPRSPPA